MRIARTRASKGILICMLTLVVALLASATCLITIDHNKSQDAVIASGGTSGDANSSRRIWVAIPLKYTAATGGGGMDVVSISRAVNNKGNALKIAEELTVEDVWLDSEGKNKESYKYISYKVRTNRIYDFTIKIDDNWSHLVPLAVVPDFNTSKTPSRIITTGKITGRSDVSVIHSIGQHTFRISTSSAGSKSSVMGGAIMQIEEKEFRWQAAFPKVVDGQQLTEDTKLGLGDFLSQLTTTDWPNALRMVDVPDVTYNVTGYTLNTISYAAARYPAGTIPNPLPLVLDHTLQVGDSDFSVNNVRRHNILTEASVIRTTNPASTLVLNGQLARSEITVDNWKEWGRSAPFRVVFDVVRAGYWVHFEHGMGASPPADAVTRYKTTAANFNSHFHPAGSDVNRFTQGAFVRPYYTFNGWKIKNPGQSNDGDFWTLAENYPRSVKDFFFPSLAAVATLPTTGSITLEAQWRANELTINFNSSGATSGSGTLPTTAGWNKVVNDNGTFRSMTAPGHTYTSPGRSFTGWQITDNGVAGNAPWSLNTSRELKDLAPALQNGNTSITLMPIWEPNKLEVTFAPDGAGANRTARGGTVTSATANSMDSQRLMRFSATNDTRMSLGAETINVTAWSGGYPENKYVIPGYTFDGWRIGTTDRIWRKNSPALTAEELAPNSLLTGSTAVVLTATWKPNQLVIGFLSGGATGNPPANIPESYGVYDNNGNPTEIDLPVNRYSKTGQKFIGWKVSSTDEIWAIDKKEARNLAGKQANTDVSLLMNNPEVRITLTAEWGEAAYRIKYDSGTGEGTRASAPNNNPLASVTCPALNVSELGTFKKDGHTLVGWKHTATGTTAVTNGVEIRGNETMPPTALFGRAPNDGDEFTLTAIWAPNRIALTLVNKINNQTVNTVNFGEHSVTNDEGANTIIRWNRLFFANETSGPARFTNQGHKLGGYDIYNTNHFGSGSLFIGDWQSGTETMTVLALGGDEVQRGTINFTPRNVGIRLETDWVADTYKIFYRDQDDFEFSGNENPGEHLYGRDTNVGVATRDGYSFGGWFLDPACAQELTKVSGVYKIRGIEFTADITLYAKWTPHTVMITYNRGIGGQGNYFENGSNSASLLSTESLPFPDQGGFTNPGRTLSGWNIELGNAAGTVWTAIEDSPWTDGAPKSALELTGNAINTRPCQIHLTARWGANPLTIVFRAGTGTGSKASPTTPPVFDESVPFPDMGTIAKVGHSNLTSEDNAATATWNMFTVDPLSDPETYFPGGDITKDPISNRTWVKGTGTGARTVSSLTNDEIEDGPVTLYLYPKWTAKKYGIFLLDAGGTALQDDAIPANMPHVYGEDTQLPIPTKAGHYFEGWYQGDSRAVPTSNKVTLGYTTRTLNLGKKADNPSLDADTPYDNFRIDVTNAGKVGANLINDLSSVDDRTFYAKFIPKTFLVLYYDVKFDRTLTEYVTNQAFTIGTYDNFASIRYHTYGADTLLPIAGTTGDTIQLKPEHKNPLGTYNGPEDFKGWFTNHQASTNAKLSRENPGNPNATPPVAASGKYVLPGTGTWYDPNNDIIRVWAQWIADYKIDYRYQGLAEGHDDFVDLGTNPESYAQGDILTQPIYLSSLDDIWIDGVKLYEFVHWGRLTPGEYGWENSPVTLIQPTMGTNAGKWEAIPMLTWDDDIKEFVPTTGIQYFMAKFTPVNLIVEYIYCNASGAEVRVIDNLRAQEYIAATRTTRTDNTSFMGKAEADALIQAVGIREPFTSPATGSVQHAGWIFVGWSALGNKNALYSFNNPNIKINGHIEMFAMYTLNVAPLQSVIDIVNIGLTGVADGTPGRAELVVARNSAQGLVSAVMADATSSLGKTVDDVKMHMFDLKELADAIGINVLDPEITTVDLAPLKELKEYLSEYNTARRAPHIYTFSFNPTIADLAVILAKYNIASIPHSSEHGTLVNELERLSNAVDTLLTMTNPTAQEVNDLRDEIIEFFRVSRTTGGGLTNRPNLVAGVPQSLPAFKTAKDDLTEKCSIIMEYARPSNQGGWSMSVDLMSELTTLAHPTTGTIMVGLSHADVTNKQVREWKADLFYWVSFIDIPSSDRDADGWPKSRLVSDELKKELRDIVELLREYESNPPIIGGGGRIELATYTTDLNKVWDAVKPGSPPLTAQLIKDRRNDLNDLVTKLKQYYPGATWPAADPVTGSLKPPSLAISNANKAKLERLELVLESYLLDPEYTSATKTFINGHIATCKNYRGASSTMTPPAGGWTNLHARELYDVLRTFAQANDMATDSEGLPTYRDVSVPTLNALWDLVDILKEYPQYNTNAALKTLIDEGDALVKKEKAIQGSVTDPEAKDMIMQIKNYVKTNCPEIPWGDNDVPVVDPSPEGALKTLQRLVDFLNDFDAGTPNLSSSHRSQLGGFVTEGENMLSRNTVTERGVTELITRIRDFANGTLRVYKSAIVTATGDYAPYDATVQRERLDATIKIMEEYKPTTSQANLARLNDALADAQEYVNYPYTTKARLDIVREGMFATCTAVGIPVETVVHNGETKKWPVPLEGRRTVLGQLEDLIHKVNYQLPLLDVSQLKGDLFGRLHTAVLRFDSESQANAATVFTTKELRDSFNALFAAAVQNGYPWVEISVPTHPKGLSTAVIVIIILTVLLVVAAAITYPTYRYAKKNPGALKLKFENAKAKLGFKKKDKGTDDMGGSHNSSYGPQSTYNGYGQQ